MLCFLFLTKTQKKQRQKLRAILKERIEEVARIVVDCGYHIHRRLGPALFESVYEAILAQSLSDRGLKVERQKPIEIKYDQMVFSEGFRADLLVEDCLLIELKSIEALNPVHMRQLLTYLRLMDLPLGLLMNFGAATYGSAVQRVINGFDHKKTGKN